MERIAGGRHLAGDTPERYYTAVDVEAQRLETLVNRLLEAQKLQTGQKQTYVFEPTGSRRSPPMRWSDCGRRRRLTRSRWLFGRSRRCRRWPARR